MERYEHGKIEKKWQQRWEAESAYTTKDFVEGKENFYQLFEFPYPSGNLHVGHWYAFAVPDIVARFKRMKGYNVLYPIGFDAFGLPAENAAIKRGINPREWTYDNMDHMRSQMRSMGASFDWSREVVTCDSAYYKWTQWLFLQLFAAGLAEHKGVEANWCPSCKTVLANEQVVNGQCERCDSAVVKKQMKQWQIGITKYADRLIDDLEGLDWPQEIKTAQKNWISRSEGASLSFPLRVGSLGSDTSRSADDIDHFSRNDAEQARKVAEGDGGTRTSGIVDLLYEELSYDIRGAFFAVRTAIGLGHKESVYHKALLIEFEKRGISVETEKNIDILYEDQKVGTYRPDIIVEGKVLIELKALPKIGKQQKEQIWTYLRGSEYKLGMLVNFSPSELEIERIVYDKVRKNTTISPTSSLADPSDRNSALLASIPRDSATSLEVFTTRPDTLYGVTYMVVAPEHSIISKLKDQIVNSEEVEKYTQEAAKKSEIDRTNDTKEKTGMKLEGIGAINPASGKEIPVYVADYVLGGYGTGAIMAVPAHDERDYAFAQKYDIPIKQVIAPYFELTGDDAMRDGVETLKRRCVDMIIESPDGDSYLLQKEDDAIHLVGGGVDEGESLEEAARRETLEETGYTDIASINAIHDGVYAAGFRYTKQKNLTGVSITYVIKLETLNQVPSEIEQGKHEVLWVKKEEVNEMMTWPHHKFQWSCFADNKIFVGSGKLLNSGEFDGMDSEEAKVAIVDKIGGKMTRTYKLRDWTVSRQRYWGCPIPIIHCESCGPVAVPDAQLPVELPDVEDYLPNDEGRSPLSKVESFVHVSCPSCGKDAKRETDTFDTFMCSSWYFLRYCDPQNSSVFADMKSLEHWMPVGHYSGGAEHTTMHLLYSRFFTKALADLDLLPSGMKNGEPYRRRMNRSLILGPDGNKMSKSKGNVIDPDDIVKSLGGDTMRLYLAFVGPYNEVGAYPWNPESIIGVRRFVERVWRLSEKVSSEASVDAEVDREVHIALKRLTESIEDYKLNTGVAALMQLLNVFDKQKHISAEDLQMFLTMLAPYAPHLSSEMWEMQKFDGSAITVQWPKVDEEKLISTEMTLIVQVNGKVKDKIMLPSGSDDAALEEAARTSEKVQKYIGEKEIRKVIVIKGKLVNIVV